MDKIYIVEALRTPVGRFQGALKNVSAPHLGALVIAGILSKNPGLKDHIESIWMGHVLTAGVGQAPARQTARYAELPVSVEATTVGKVCGSGLHAIALAANHMACGQANLSLAGGQENMSLAPYLLPSARAGMRMGNGECLDSMIIDGLWDPYNQLHMGQCAEKTAAELSFTRETQDAFAHHSYQKARTAIAEKLFDNEVISVNAGTGKTPLVVNQDEEPLFADLSKISSLRPAFGGTITAANASKINDGAAVTLLATESALKTHNIKPIARIVAYAGHAQEPIEFATAPVGAIQKALKKAGLLVNDIGLWEINEAFALVTMAACLQLNIDKTKVNVNGGACAIGHPIGASGARILTTLIHALRHHKQRYGVASLCIGGGEAVAMVIEAL